MIDVSKPIYNSFGEVKVANANRDGFLVRVEPRTDEGIMYWTVNGKAPIELGEKFDVFNKLTQKEKALAELVRYNEKIIENGFCASYSVFIDKFPEISKLITED